MLEDNLFYLVYLHSIWINHKKLHFIFKNNQNYKDFFDNLSYNNLRKFYNDESKIYFILDNYKKIDIQKIQNKLKQRQVKIITIFDRDYPESFRYISNSPFLFYLRWIIDKNPKISVVWSRKISTYWENVIKNFIPDISKYFTIVSWWASWCDSFAHIETLKNWRKTLSIIWTWIDIDYPVKNEKLYFDIVESWGWVISIFPIWEVWNPYNFPIRNELVAWISNWVLVIEAWEKSWTLITANLALDLWKELFAVAWDIFKANSKWCNNLIKNWYAKAVTCSSDILDEFNIFNKNNLNIERKFSDKQEEEIYNLLLLENLSIDELSKKLLLDIQTILFKIWFLEIKNYIKKWDLWKYYIC